MSLAEELTATWKPEVACICTGMLPCKGCQFNALMRDEAKRLVCEVIERCAQEAERAYLPSDMLPQAVIAAHIRALKDGK